jgi:hypothetical protein
MKVLLAVLIVISFTAQADMRCGWLDNPTPGNFWLEDAQGSWLIGAQGGYQAKGDAYDSNSSHNQVYTNGHYGFTCACLDVKTSNIDGDKKVIEVKATYGMPLSACQNDNRIADREITQITPYFGE